VNEKMEKSSINNNAKNNINIHKETSKITKEFVKNANNISENSKAILLQVLIQLYRAGFRKLIPLFEDSRRANVYDNLVSDFHQQKVNP
jgi:hypothetical protein